MTYLHATDVCAVIFGLLVMSVPAEDIPTVDLLCHALAHARVRSVGLKVELRMRVPPLVHAAVPAIQETVRVFDRGVVVDFEATSFKCDFGGASVANHLGVCSF